MIVSQWNQVIAADLRKIAREPFFWLILLAPFFLGALLHSFLPYLTTRFQNFDLSEYYPLIIALFVLAPPMYYGIVLALQVLEEKDENVLIAVAVTPITLPKYLGARIIVYTLVSIPIIMIVHEMIGVLSIDRLELLGVAIAASLSTPLLVMLLAAFANNQLEGMVIGKGLGFVILFPLAMFFVPDYWHLLCGVLPTYWPIIAYFTAVSETGSPLFFYFAVVMAVVTQLAATVLLYRRFANGLLAA